MVKYKFEVDHENNQIVIDPEAEPTTTEANQIAKEIETYFVGFELMWPDYNINYLPFGEQTF